MGFKTYNQFINESNPVKLDKDLHEYDLTFLDGSQFDLKSDNFYKQFSVLPYKSEDLDKLKDIHEKLQDSIESLDVNELYKNVIEAELIPYSYGNVYPTKFSLNIIPDLSLLLDDNQRNTMTNSEKEFLINNFSTLSKEVKDLIIDTLQERAEVLCAVIEALFYYLRSVDTDKFYNMMSQSEILDTYQDEIDKANKETSFSYEGPFSTETKLPVNDSSESCIWLCEKDMKKFQIKSTISPKMLKAEKHSGNKGLKFSIIMDEELTNDFRFFDIEELKNRIELLNKKYIKNGSRKSKS